jgi:F-type H+-transporting ATPase subunit gamma
MMAMRNATDAAEEMVDNLTLIYNQIRQMKITQEIAEISAGRAALEQ